MKTFIISVSLLFLISCSSTSKVDEDRTVSAWLNESKKASFVEPSKLNLNAQRIFVLLLHTKEGAHAQSSTIDVVSVESYGPELEIWILQRPNGELVEYNLENQGTNFRVRNLKAERESNDQPLEISLQVGSK
ncbi:hypothetical protein OAP14_01225 [Aliiglaciecola sp.]|nr:hypothetical protein [Aliiglaciecola sp.]